jgi:hypothetical protein
MLCSPWSGGSNRNARCRHRCPLIIGTRRETAFRSRELPPRRASAQIAVAWQEQRDQSDGPEDAAVQHAALAADESRGVTQVPMREPSSQAADPAGAHSLRVPREIAADSTGVAFYANHTTQITLRKSRKRDVLQARFRVCVTRCHRCGDQAHDRRRQRAAQLLAFASPFRRRLRSTPSAACESSAAQRTGSAHAGSSRRRNP